MSTIKNIKINEIIVDENIKENVPNENALKVSIQECGLMNPLVITESKHLVDGFFRLRICKDLGFKEVPCRIIPDEIAEQFRNLISNK